MAKQTSPSRFQAFRFTVFGEGVFPVDMLRYDRCVPDTQEDVALAFTARRDRRHVRLIGYAERGREAQPTGGRWLSFGWGVLEGSVKVVR